MASSSTSLRSVIEIGDTPRHTLHFASSRGMSSTAEGGSALTPEVYSLKWNAYQSHVTSGLARLLLDQEYTDVTLACDGQFIQTHKLILSLCSPYFKRMFQVNKAPQTGNIIIIMDNVQFHDLENIVKFIYNGEVNVRNVDLNGFLFVGEILQIEGLSSASACTQNAGLVKQTQRSAADPTTLVKTQYKSDTQAVQNRALGLSDRNSLSSSMNSQFTAGGNARTTSSTIISTSRNQTIASKKDTIPVIMLDDPLETNPSCEAVEDMDPLRLNGTGIEISEIVSSMNARAARGDSFESSDSVALTNDESYQTYEPGVNPEIVYDDQGSNQEEEEEYVEMTEDFLDNTHTSQHRSINMQEFHQRSRIGTLAGYKNATPYRAPEQRRKTSALWDYFIYDTERDLVQCQLKRNGMPCPFNARHKPLSNMKYHIRTCHSREFNIILPRLLSR